MNNKGKFSYRAFRMHFVVRPEIRDLEKAYPNKTERQLYKLIKQSGKYEIYTLDGNRLKIKEGQYRIGIDANPQLKGEYLCQLT